MTDDQWVEVIQTNLNGCFYCTSAAIPIMTAQSYGRIINISSMNGQVPAMGQANYSASKGGDYRVHQDRRAGAGSFRYHGEYGFARLHGY